MIVKFQNMPPGKRSTDQPGLFIGIAVIAGTVIGLTGCGQQAKDNQQSPVSSEQSLDKLHAITGSTGDKIDKSRSNNIPGTSAALNETQGTKKYEIAGTKKTISSISGGTDNDSLLADLAAKLIKYKLAKLPDSTTICSINGVPVTVGDYRRELKNEEQQLQASLTYNPQLASNLMQTARRQGITLSRQEQDYLIKSASKMQTGGQKSFNKMLNDSHLTMKQFDNQMMEVELARKAGNAMIEQGLLDELVDRQLLSQAAKEDGFSKEAMNKYEEVSKSPEYKKLLSTGAFSAEDLRDEIIVNQLCQEEMEKIRARSTVTDAELNDFYEKNRGKLRHGARVRLSHIFIALPDKKDMLADKGGSKEQNQADLEKQIASAQKEKYKLAQNLHERASNGEDFAALADQYSDDPAKNKKDGGNLGFIEEAKLAKDFAPKITKLPAGTVVPEIIISPRGYHIFKVTAKESPGFYRLDDVKNELKQAVSEEKGKQLINNWLDNERRRATIAISPTLNKLLATNKLDEKQQKTSFLDVRKLMSRGK